MTSLKRNQSENKSNTMMHAPEYSNNESSEKSYSDIVYQPPPYHPREVVEPQSQALRDEKFQSIVNKYEIRLEYANILQQLQGFKIVFIFDDSGSMNSVLNESPLNDNKIGFLKVISNTMQSSQGIKVKTLGLGDGLN